MKDIRCMPESEIRDLMNQVAHTAVSKLRELLDASPDEPLVGVTIIAKQSFADTQKHVSLITSGYDNATVRHLLG